MGRWIAGLCFAVAVVVVGGVFHLIDIITTPVSTKSLEDPDDIDLWR